jgi:hypothetical protein
MGGVGVSVGMGVADGTGVSVDVGRAIVDVHVGTSVYRSVTVGVSVYSAGFNVGGGNGLRLLSGLRKISVKYERTQSKAIKTITVKIFHTRAPGPFGGGGSSTSETSYESIVLLPIQSCLWH